MLVQNCQSCLDFKRNPCILLIRLLYIIGLIYTSSIATYHGHVLYEIKTKDEPARIALNYLLHSSESNLFDIWKFTNYKNQSVHVLTAPKGIRLLKVLQKHQNIYLKILKRDIERAIRLNKFANDFERKHHRHKRSELSLRHLYYMTYSEIEQTLQLFAQNYKHVNLEVVGKTHENRTLLLVKISTNSSKPIIWVDAGIHAREWIAPATAMYIIDMLLSEEGKILLENYQFYIFPCVNPDGYHYTFTNARLWRKNRAPVLHSICRGVDLNRNFPYKWGTIGYSQLPCREIYCGERGGDQLETQAMMKQLNQIKNITRLYLTLHSYGQYFLTPYGYSSGKYPQNYDKLISMASKIIYKVQELYGTQYMTGSSSDLLYPASGASDDYVSGMLNVPYTYTVELPDEGNYNFLLPPAYIPLIGRQIWKAIEILVEEM